MKPRRAALAAALAACMALQAGCRSVNVHFAGKTDPPAPATILTFPFDEAREGNVTSEHVVLGRTGAQGSGTLVSQELARGLESEAGFRPLAKRALRKLLDDHSLTMEQLKHSDPSQACMLGREAGADVALTGAIRRYETRWFLFFRYCRVAFTARAYETASCRLIWWADADITSGASSEAKLSREISLEIARKVAENMERGDKPESQP